MEVADGIDEGIALAIQEGIRAGKYWQAAILIPRLATLYVGTATTFHQRAGTLLDDAMCRIGVEPTYGARGV